jgi:uncharacterized membrane protein
MDKSFEQFAKKPRTKYLEAPEKYHKAPNRVIVTPTLYVLTAYIAWVTIWAGVSWFVEPTHVRHMAFIKQMAITPTVLWMFGAWWAAYVIAAFVANKFDIKLEL